MIKSGASDVETSQISFIRNEERLFVIRDVLKKVVSEVLDFIHSTEGRNSISRPLISGTNKPDAVPNLAHDSQTRTRDAKG